MLKSLCLLLWIAMVPVLFAQGAAGIFEQAPPHIDEALRARVAVFFDAHMEGHSRRMADTVVHEDSKDAFFEARKEPIKAFEILKIEYSEDFTKAKVVTEIEKNALLPQFGRMDLKIPLATYWKLDAGEWWWYVRPASEGIETPFGVIMPDENPEEANRVASQLASLPAADDAEGRERERQRFLSQVRVSKTDVILKSYEPSSDEITVENGMLGEISLHLRSETHPGFEATLDQTTLGPKQVAKILFHIEPKSKLPLLPLDAILTVHPSGLQIPIKIRFQSPPAPVVPSEQ